MRLVIDTNIWIRLLQKERAVGEHLARALNRGAAVLVPTIVQFEVMRGLHRRRDRESIRFVREPWRRVRAIEMSAPIWSKAVRLWTQATAANRTPGDADVLIAAVAAVHSARIVTENVSDFALWTIPTANWNLDRRSG